MKKLCVLFAFVLTAASYAQAATALKFTWTPPTTPDTACTTTLKTGCTSGWQIADTTSLTPVIIAGPGVLTTATLTYTESPLPSVGSHTFTIVSTGFDQSGNVIASAVTASTTAVVAVPAITLQAPTGFTAVPQ